MRGFAERLERLLELGGVRKDVVLLVLGGAGVACSLAGLRPLPFDMAWIAIVLCGVPILLEAFIGLVTAFDIKADVLVSIALIASLIIGEDFAAGEVAFIMQLGALLEDLTVAKARAGIEKLVHLTPQTARRLTDGGEEIIPAEQVAVGDALRVLPGETVPVDGVILTGQTSIDQAVMTGESLPVDKGPGDGVSSGTVNQYRRLHHAGGEGGGGQLHPADGPAGPLRRRRQGEDRGAGGPVGHLDRGGGPVRRRPDGPHHPGPHPGGDHPGGVLPLRPGAGHPHSHHGRHRQRHEAQLPGAGGRRPGAAGLRDPGDL